MPRILQQATESENPDVSSDQEKMFKELNSAFKKLYGGPNVYTLSEFQVYKPLFNTELSKSYSETDLIRLSNKFFSEINPYKETQIFRSKDDATPITTLPSLFTQAQSMPNTEEAERVSGKYSKMGRHDIPKYANDAMKPFVELFLGAQSTEQNVDNILEERRAYRRTMAAFYGIEEASSSEEDAKTPQTNDIDDWDFE